MMPSESDDSRLNDDRVPCFNENRSGKLLRTEQFERVSG
jgi:hypothetical protein